MSPSTPCFPNCFSQLRLLLFSAAVAATVALPVCFGQEPEPAEPAVDLPEGLTVEQLWKDGLHYFKIGRFSYGKAYLQAFLDRKPDPSVALKLSEESPEDPKVLTKLTANPDLQEVASKALELIDKGWDLRRRDVNYIAGELERLDRGPRARFHAVERLKQSGEYAVPVMINYLEDPAKDALYAKIVATLFELGRPAVEPTLAALPHVSSGTQGMLIDLLEQWAYPQALPYLKTLAQSAKDQAVRADAEAAVVRIANMHPRYRPDVPAAVMFYDLAKRYYAGDSALAPDARADMPNVWYWREGEGLVFVAVPRDIYFEIMTMRCTDRALALKGDFSEAVALWLSANFRREAKLSEAVSDPVHGEDFPQGIYFACSAGAQHSLMVLSEALSANEPVVALGAIKALRSTAGQASLFGFAGKSQPLIDALNFENQTVSIHAALALGEALRGKSFEGSGNVVPALATALARSGQMTAAVVDPQQENLNRVSGILRGAGYKVISGTNFDAVNQAMQDDAASLEAIVLATDLSKPAADVVLEQLSGDFVFRSVPTLILIKPGQTSRAEQLGKAHPRVAMVFSNAGGEQILGKLGDLQRAGGRVILSEEDAFNQALDAARTLYLIGLCDSQRYDIKRAEKALIDALGAARTELQLAAAEALSVVNTAEAQRALARYAGNVSLEKQYRIEGYGYLAESAKRYGNLLSEDLVEALVRVSL